MKKTPCVMMVLFGLIWGALAPAPAATIYTEDWGNASAAVHGDGNIYLVGWTGICQRQTNRPYLGIYAAAGPSDPANGSALPPNTAYFTGLTSTFQTGAGMLYTTDTSGSGSGGDSAFVDIDPTLYTNLTINIEERSGGAFLTNYFAVQVGGAWYVATSYQFPNSAPLSYPMFTNASLIYTNPANVWNALTLGTTNVTIGSVASPSLTSKITGIGIVELNNPTGGAAGDGLNYNELVINQGTLPPTPAQITAAAITPQYAYVGGGASFLIGAAGTPILSYQWQTNGVNVSGARYLGTQTAMLTITNINANDALPSYSVIVTNLLGKATNSGLSLMVSPVPDGVLYAETFPYVGLNGNLPITGVGWSSAASGGAFGIYSPGPGLGDVFSYSATATTNAYFTTDLLDTGLSGLPFVDINPASYPAVTFQCNFTPGNAQGQVPGDVTVYWAVQMNGTWYSSAKPIGISLASVNNYLTNQLAFNPASTNWNNLTIDTVNNLTVIGSQASSPLAGNITGAGLVFVHSTSVNGGDINFQNFEIITNAVTLLAPYIGTSIPLSQTVASGGGASFGVAATGTQPFSYGWTTNGVLVKDGGRVSGSSTPTLTIANVSSADNNMQIVAFVTNSVGYDESDSIFNPIALTVTNPAVGLIYSESFPFVGPLGGAGNNYPISSAGWVEAVSGAPNALYQTSGSDGAVFAYFGTPATTVYYATTASDTNQSGLPFPNINLAAYGDPSSLNLSVDIAPSSSASNVTAYLAVQLNGANWYVAASPLPVPTASDDPTFTTYNTAFNPAAANWNNLTVSSSGGIIGSAAAGDLKGVMTGAGLVFVTVGTGGNFNFDNFIITGTGVGGINVGPLAGGSMNLSWVGNPAVNLQSTTSLSVPNWLDVPNTYGLYSLPVSVAGPPKFFRLQSP
jgi:hypothetical protein